MANTFTYIIHHFIFSSLILLCAFHESSSNSLSSLRYDYYNQTCPNIEKIIYDVVFQKLSETPNVAAGALRIFFHDCFVEGCDASVLTASNATNQAEREAEINLSLPGDGYDVFFRAKRALELHCPGVVSCADVMAIATRDLTNLVGGPHWQVQKGRKDGLISNRARVEGNLPRPTHTVTEMIQLFQSKGLTTRDLVALSGAHSIGFTHCTAIMGRIYYNGTYDIDPTMNATYARDLRTSCPMNNTAPEIVVFNDVTTPKWIDNAYYGNLKRGYGLLSSDQNLYLDDRTKWIVESMINDETAFFDAFASAMEKLGTVGVKTGRDGEVRLQCDLVNGSN